MPPLKAAVPPTSRHRQVVAGLLAVVLIGGIISFVLSGNDEESAPTAEEFQIVDIIAPPPPPPPPPDEETMEEPEDIEELVEPLEISTGPENPSEESSEVDLGIDIGDLVASSGSGFVMDIPRFGRGGGGGGDGDGGLLGGETDSPPAPMNKTQPTYPSSLLKKGIGGKVLVTCIVDPDGQVTGTTIKQSSGHPDLDKAAINAVNKWKFKPGTKNGRKIKAVCVVPFNFEVKKA